MVLEYLNNCIKYKKTLLISVGLVAILTIILVFFVMQPIFFSTATVKTSNPGSLGMLTGDVPDIGALSDLAGGSSTAKELALYESILTSRRCIEETIIRFNLNEKWEFKYMQDAVKFFREEIMTLSIDKIAGTMEVGVYDEDPVRAKDVTDFLVMQLNKINTELNIQDAKNNREFLEERYNIVRKDLKAMEDSLENFQEIYGVAPDLQVQAAVKTQIEIEVQIKSEEVKLELLRKILTPDQPEIKAQQEKIAALNNQLAEMQNSSVEEHRLNLKGSPAVVIDYLRIKRDLEIQNKLLAFIIPLFEQSKIEENKETPSVLILDQAYVAEKKTKPKRLTSVLINIIVSFAIFSLMLFVYEKYVKVIINSLRQANR